MEPAAASFQPIFLPAPGARLRCARFDPDPASSPGGVAMLLTGQSEFIEKYFEVIDDLRRRGFAVAIMDWRGQGGSERPLPDPLKIYVADFSEYDSDIHTLMAALVQPMLAAFGFSKAVAVAHSMGGHILLRTLLKTPALFAAVAITAPMMAIRMPLPPALVRTIATAQARRDGTRFAWGIEGRDPLNQTFATQIVTSDPVRFARTQALLQHDPGLRVGGPTWGWLAAATRSMADLLRPGVAERITTPLLVCDVGNDLVCFNAAAIAFAGRLPRGISMVVPDARHEILMERDCLRDQFWQVFDRFLAKEYAPAG